MKAQTVAEVCAPPLAKQTRKEAFREGFIHALNAARHLRAQGFTRPDEIIAILSAFAAGELKGYSLEPGEAWESTAPKVWTGSTWWDIRQVVLARDGHRCVACGSTEDLHVDHVHPVVRGGRPLLANLQTLCKTCNLQKGAR